MDGETVLQVRNLGVSYQGTRILEDISLQFLKGKIYAVIGPNGCGKTTLMKTMNGSLKPDRGQVLLMGENMARMKTRAIARRMAIVSQNHTGISDVTVEKLVQYGRFAHRSWWQGGGEEDSHIVDRALERTGLKGLAHRKLDTLSGGERQRAWIAMAVAQRPEIMLLDEPTTYLDISHQLEIMELVNGLNKEEGITIVMVIHDINHAARYADEMVVLKDHHVYQVGEPEQIVNPDLFRRVFRVEGEISRDAESSRPVFYARRVI